MDSQATLKQPTRSGRLLIGMPATIAKRKKPIAVCDSRCPFVKRCTKCLRKRTKQRDDRGARFDKRKGREADAAEQRPRATQSRGDWGLSPITA
eukprot:917570-Prymnesium_polylepis.1